MRFVPINQSDVPAVGSAVRLTKSFLSYLTGTAREMPVPLREPASPTSVQVLPHQGPSSVKVIVIIERTVLPRGPHHPRGFFCRQLAQAARTATHPPSRCTSSGLHRPTITLLVGPELGQRQSNGAERMSREEPVRRLEERGLPLSSASTSQRR